VRDNASSLAGRLVVLRPDPASVPAPTDAQLDEVFNTYRDNLPGAGKPFPFGYRYPDRVRGRYLSVSGEAIRAAVDVPYLDVKTYYLANPSAFADEEGNTPERPTAEARRQITQQLTDRGAQALADRVQAFVAGKVAESIRGFEGRRGYYTLSADHQSMDLDALAAQVKDEFDVAATVAGDPQAWAAVADLSNALRQPGARAGRGSRRRDRQPADPGRPARPAAARRRWRGLPAPAQRSQPQPRPRRAGRGA